MPYKIVTLRRIGLEEPLRYFSWYMRDLAQVEYKMGEWVEAPQWLANLGYGLTYYGLWEDLPWNSGPVYEIEVDSPFEGELPPFLGMGPLTQGIIQYDPSKANLWPRGTRMARRIKLARYIEPAWLPDESRKGHLNEEMLFSQ